MRWLPVVLLCACAPAAKNLDINQGGGDSGVTDAGELIDAGPSCGCTRWTTARDAGQVPDVLNELSGLVASRTQRGVLYAHNDSGDAARFFALSTAGVLLQTFTLPDAGATDWEDIALGPCDAGTCVYLGDIGDNNHVRTDYAIYRVPEPTVTAGAAEVAWERLPYRYPNDEKHNSEAIFMHPASGTLYLVTKESFGRSSVYRFPPLDPATTVTLEPVALLSVPAANDGQLTGADINVCGGAVLLRMYNRVVELRLPADAVGFEDIFIYAPVEVPRANEEQGEAVAYSADGMGYFTASESAFTPAALSTFSCRD